MRSACSVRDCGSDEVPLLVTSVFELSLSEAGSAGVFWLWKIDCKIKIWWNKSLNDQKTIDSNIFGYLYISMNLKMIFRSLIQKNVPAILFPQQAITCIGAPLFWIFGLFIANLTLPYITGSNRPLSPFFHPLILLWYPSMINWLFNFSFIH